MIGNKKWIKTRAETEEHSGYHEYICYNFSSQYYKFICVEKDTESPRFVKIPIIANLSSDWILMYVDDN
jgi:hypothetical protein